MKLLKKANGNIIRTAEEIVEMKKNAEIAYAGFLTALGFDYLADENSKDTPRRVAKAWVDDIINGTLTSPPIITTFPNYEQNTKNNFYSGMVFEGNIPVTSLCSHHNLPFTGVAHIAYIPGMTVMGLSKINRIVEWFSRRPQLQEALTTQIHNYINEICNDNFGIAVLIEASHSCVSCRGIKHQNTITKTALLSGAFRDEKNKARDEFYQFVSKI